MLKKTIVLIISLIAVVFLASSCSNNTQKTNLVGQWKLNEEFDEKGLRIPMKLEFLADMTVQANDNIGGKYSTDGDKLHIYYAAMDSYTYNYKINGDTLLLKSDSENDNTEYIYTKINAVEKTINEKDKISTTAEPRLSDSCETVLCYGTTSTGDIIELVGNSSQTYDGKAQIGVIKNNQWYIKLTSDNPFIIDSGYYSPSNHYYSLITDTCFAVKGIFWNFEKNISSLDIKETDDIMRAGFGDTLRILSTPESRTSLIPVVTLGNCIRFLDINTMSISDTIIKDVNKYYAYAYPIYEGLFFVEITNACGFYNDKGEYMIDMNKYWSDIDYDELNSQNGKYMIFMDGKCNFPVKNSSNKKFILTIDKTGKVISETPIN